MGYVNIRLCVGGQTGETCSTGRNTCVGQPKYCLTHDFIDWGNKKYNIIIPNEKIGFFTDASSE